MVNASSIQNSLMLELCSVHATSFTQAEFTLVMLGAVETHTRLKFNPTHTQPTTPYFSNQLTLTLLLSN
jgi:hypothetical protein